jgi:hypothetical protein
MAFLQSMLGGGDKDGPPATVQQPQKFADGGVPAPINSNPMMANNGQSPNNAILSSKPQANPYAEASQDAHGVLSNGSNTIFNAHPGRSGQQVWGDTATGVIPGGQGTGPMATIAQPIGAVIGGIGQMGQNAAHGIGDTFQGIGSAFTAQNQYQAQLAPTSNLDYTGIVNQAAGNSLSGYQQFAQNQAQQQNVANQLAQTGQQYQGIANGTGPNPALNQLNQTTGQNVANQAALMAGQRGAGSNVGLMARQNAMNGAATQQNAAGTAATLAANQQIAGLAGLQSNQAAQGSLYGQMGSQVQGEQGANNNLYNTSVSANNTQNANDINNYSMMQGINSSVAQNNANAVNKTTSGMMGGVASVFGLAHGGKVPKFADGGDVDDSEDKSVPNKKGPISGAFGGGQQAPVVQIHNPYAIGVTSDNSPSPFAPQQSDSPEEEEEDSDGPKSSVGQILKNMGNQQQAANMQAQAMTPQPVGNMQQPMMARGGKVPALVSPGEKYLSPQEAKAVAHGKASPAQVGKIVPGTPKVRGNSYANDVVPAKLTPGGIVIPNSIMQSADPVKGAAAFVKAHMKSKVKGKKK